MEVEYEEDYIKNSRGVQLFSCRWLPLSSPPKALVFLCHGYGMECSGFMRGCGTRLAAAGYAVYGIDYEGHGRSMGARCYINKFDNIVTDCDRHFKSICEREENQEKRRFLYGESMGGAVALLLHRKDPIYWDGAILVAPMCKISEKVKPHPLVVAVLTRMEEIIPKWKIVPTKDIYDNAFKDPIKRQEREENREKRRFLYGESMGGAVALLLHRKDPIYWDGAILVAPMCKISEKVKPHPLVVAVLTRMEEIIPKWKIVPTKDIYDMSSKKYLDRIRRNKLLYKDKPRLKTALELLRTSIDLEDSLTQVMLPFFVLHGEADTVTDPEVSRALYERASSQDKTMKLYPGMWHGLTSGEPDRNIDVVFADIVAWLDNRTDRRAELRRPPVVKENGGSGGFQVGSAAEEVAELRSQRRQRRRGRVLCGLTVGPRHHAAM